MTGRADLVVVDASVTVKWFAPEILTEEALRVPGLYSRLIAPDTIVAEVSSALLKKVRRREMAAPLVHTAINIVQDRVSTSSTLGFEHDAFDMAERHGCSVYDALYVLLALQEGCQLVTADDRLFNAVKGVYPDTLLWLGDVTAGTA